jgi:xanthine dehydrogenase accessory factor
MERSELLALISAYRQARNQGSRMALCTVVRVHGSAYRREGAKMLVLEDGSQVCMLSGGCLEPEVALEAQNVISTGQAVIRGYDLSEDIVWGMGIGCGGDVDILIEPLEGAMLETWLDLLETGSSAVLATFLDDVNPVRRILIQPGDDETSQIHNTALEMLRALHPRAETRAIDGTDVFFDISAPAPQLMIFGAGHDAIPLVAQAVALGWMVTVADSRQAFLTTSRFPNTTLVNTGIRFEDTPIPQRAFVLLMNHHLERDTSALRHALSSDAAYIGVLGPHARFKKMLESLGLTKNDSSLERVVNPIGLDVGAESPNEVALAIIAELMAVQRGYGGGRLRGLTGRIHDQRAGSSKPS